jgi:hypothetical protein
MVRDWNELPLLLAREHMCALFHNCCGKTIRRGVLDGTMLAPLDPDAKRQFWRREEVQAWVEAGCPPMSEWLKRRRRGDGNEPASKAG